MIHVISPRKDIRATTDIDSHEQEIESWGRPTVFCDLYNSTHAVFYRASWHESKESENLLIECWNYLDWQFCWLKALHFSTVIPYSRNRFYCMNLQKKWQLKSDRQAVRFKSRLCNLTYRQFQSKQIITLTPSEFL